MINHSNIKQKQKANTMLSVAIGEHEAAKILIERKIYRESLIHMYFCSFYLSQAVCADMLIKTSHKHVKAILNQKYGKGGGEIPKLYVNLHNKLHEARNNMNYKTPIIPSEESIRRFYKTLDAYMNCVERKFIKITIFEIILNIHEKNRLPVKGFSYDIYCPKTYSHHNRVTFWQPPFHFDIYSPEKIMKELRDIMKRLRIKKPANYVLGLNSRVDQYADNHYIMLDFDSLDTEVESSLANEMKGVLLKSGRGYHFIGNDIIQGKKIWEKEIRRIGRIKELKGRIDKSHIEISIKRGYSTLRITSNEIKPNIPIFYKEISKLNARPKRIRH